MTDRQRFKLIARCELKGELFVPSDFQWFWHETLVRWVNEGHLQRYFPTNTGQNSLNLAEWKHFPLFQAFQI